MSPPDSPKKPIPAFEKAAARLRKLALGYPETHEDHPWGESAFKVKGKVFLFMSTHDGRFGTSTKLPVSSSIALMLPFAEPTGYGLGKSGWISARFTPEDDLPFEILEAWIDESYRAVAPKKLAAALPPSASAANTPPAPAAKKKPAAKKAPAPATKKKTVAEPVPAAKNDRPPAAKKKPAPHMPPAPAPKKKPAAATSPAPAAKKRTVTEPMPAAKKERAPTRPTKPATRAPR